MRLSLPPVTCANALSTYYLLMEYRSVLLISNNYKAAGLHTDRSLRVT